MILRWSQTWTKVGRMCAREIVWRCSRYLWVINCLLFLMKHEKRNTSYLRIWKNATEHSVFILTLKFKALVDSGVGPGSLEAEPEGKIFVHIMLSMSGEGGRGASGAGCGLSWRWALAWAHGSPGACIAPPSWSHLGLRAGLFYPFPVRQSWWCAALWRRNGCVTSWVEWLVSRG